MKKKTNHKENVTRGIQNITEALRSAQAWSSSVFTHWQGSAADAAGERIQAFYQTEAARYYKMLQQAEQDQTRRGWKR